MKRKLIKKIVGVILAIHGFPLLMGIICLFTHSHVPPISQTLFWGGFVFGYILDIMAGLIIGFSFLLEWLFRE